MVVGVLEVVQATVGVVEVVEAAVGVAVGVAVGWERRRCQDDSAVWD